MVGPIGRRLLLAMSCILAAVPWAVSAEKHAAAAVARTGPQPDGRRGGGRGGHQGPARHSGDARHPAAQVRAAQVHRAGLLGHVAAHRPAADDFAAHAGRLHDRATRSAAQRSRLGNRHRQRLPGGRAQFVGQGGVLDRNHRIARKARRAEAQAARIYQCVRQDRRRIPGLAGEGALRQDHRHLFAGKGAAAAGGSTQRRRANDHSGRRTIPAGFPPPQKAERRAHERSLAADVVCADERRGRTGPAGATRPAQSQVGQFGASRTSPAQAASRRAGTTSAR